VKPKTPVQAVKTISNGVKSKSPKAKGSIPKKIVPQKPKTVETKPKEKVKVGLPAPKKVLKIVKSAAPKQAQKITTTPENCYNSIDEAGIQKLTAYLPNKVGGKVSCRNRLACFLGENQLQRYLEAVSKDAKCKCSAKTAKKNDVVKCQVKALSGFDLDDNPMHIYYRFSKDGKFMLNEIKEVTV